MGGHRRWRSSWIILFWRCHNWLSGAWRVFLFLRPGTTYGSWKTTLRNAEEGPFMLFWSDWARMLSHVYACVNNIHPASRRGTARTAGSFGQLKHRYKKSVKNVVFVSVFIRCSVENTVIYAVFGMKSVQNNGFCSVFKALASKNVQFRDLPKPLKTPLFTLFSSIFPCANAAGQLKHIYKNSFKNSAFYSVFTFFRRNLHVFQLTVASKQWFLQYFQCSGIQNHSKYRYLQCFFISVRFSLAGSRPKWSKIPFQWSLKLRHPKMVEKTRKHHQAEVSVRNPLWGPPPS